MGVDEANRSKCYGNSVGFTIHVKSGGNRNENSCPTEDVESYVQACYREQNLRISVIIFVLLTLIFTILAFDRSPSGSSAVTNTLSRERLELGYEYSNDTLTDEIGWVKNPGRLNRNFKKFYNTTGVIPYVALVYRPDISNQGIGAEESYANQWYSDNLPNEGYMLLMYFDTGDLDVDGNCYIICGEQVGILMDAEAQNIFWAYLDDYWYSDRDEDTLFAQTFIKTGNCIMHRQATGKDAAGLYFASAAIVCAALGVTCKVLLRRKHEAERAAGVRAIFARR